MEVFVSEKPKINDPIKAGVSFEAPLSINKSESPKWFNTKFRTVVYQVEHLKVGGVEELANYFIR